VATKNSYSGTNIPYNTINDNTINNCINCTNIIRANDTRYDDDHDNDYGNHSYNCISSSYIQEIRGLDPTVLIILLIQLNIMFVLNITLKLLITQMTRVDIIEKLINRTQTQI